MLAGPMDTEQNVQKGAATLQRVFKRLGEFLRKTTRQLVVPHPMYLEAACAKESAQLVITQPEIDGNLWNDFPENILWHTQGRYKIPQKISRKIMNF